jgi:hypothetical protein
MRSIQLILPPNPSQTVEHIARVFTRQVQQRTGIVAQATPAEFSVELCLTPSIGVEGYRIEDGAEGGVRICGNDERGLLYGVGKFLRLCGYQPGDLQPPTWRGSSMPVKPMRGIYFATHFHNYYHDAPVEQVEQYVQDLLLWGYNHVLVWFDMHHFNGIDDPQAQAMIERLHVILRAARQVGVGVGLGFLANEAYANSPQELRADWTAGHDGYHHEPGGHYHVELCPSQPGAPELLLRWVDEKFAAFSDLGLDVLWIWPYDQGGCTCSRCKPWGVNGFLRMAEPIAQHFRQAFPHSKVIVSTWYFDHFTDGEWAGLAQVFAQRPAWTDYLLADDNADQFPPYPLEHGVPGGLPMVNFPEISMYGSYPWGGYGANPLPRHLQELWDSAQHLLEGGFPYSEGIYEDMNKAVCAQFYWQPDKPALDTVREYMAFEYGPQVADALTPAIDILERNLAHHYEAGAPERRFSMPAVEQAEHACELLRQADGQLTPQARGAWRWRILYLRGLIDAELTRNNFAVSAVCQDAFDELRRIYYADHADEWVSPPRG